MKQFNIPLNIPSHSSENLQLFNGDCLEVLRELPSKSVDLVCVDLPFNIGKAYKTKLLWDIWESDEKYIQWVGYGFIEVQRVLKDSGSFYWFHNDFEMLCEIQQWIKKNTSFKFRQFITWNKRFDGGKKKSYLDGYIVEDRNMNYYKMAEYIMFYTFENSWKIKEERVRRNIKQITISQEIKSKNGNQTGWFSNIETGKYFPTPETIKPITKHLGLTMTDLVHKFNNQKEHHSVWNYEITEKSIHPTPKPIKLIESIIKHSTDVGDIVLDYCMGGGTCGVACKNTDRKFIGVDLDETYYNETLKLLI